MKNRVLKVGIVLGALMLPVAAHSQVISGAIIGGVIGGPIGAAVGASIGAVNVAAFSNYVASQSYPVYVYSSDVAVGAELPSGVVYYKVPPQYGNGYYTVLNDRVVLVDPSTRRIVEIIK